MTNNNFDSQIQTASKKIYKHIFLIQIMILMKPSQTFLLGFLILFTVGLQAQIAMTPPPTLVIPCGEIPVPSDLGEFLAAGGTASTGCANGGLAVSGAVTFNNFGTGCPGDGRNVTITYTASDACGGTQTVTQDVRVLESTQDPVITSIMFAAYITCKDEANPQITDITYLTACGFGANSTTTTPATYTANVGITGPTVIGQENCPGTIYRYTYSVSDECGRTSLPVTRDFIIRNDGPSFKSCPELLVVPGGRDISTLTLMEVTDFQATLDYTTSCGINAWVTNNFNPNAAGGPITFNLTDACGRVATCSVIVDDSNPVPAMGRYSLILFAFLVLSLSFGILYRRGSF